MRRTFFFMLCTVFYLFADSTIIYAQSADASAEDAQLSVTMSRHILKLVNTLEKTKNFNSLKGEFLHTDQDGSRLYAVKDMDSMMTSVQHIVVKKGGAASYIGTYSGDIKIRTMSFSAFTKGVSEIAGPEDKLEVVTDMKNSGGTKLIYIMKQKGIKVATYTLDMEKREGVLIVEF